MTTATAPLTIKQPGDPGYCPSCDRAGLAILVTLFGAIPTQNYARASQYGYDWVTYMEPDSTPFFRDFDKNDYLSQRKLADAKSFGSLNCSHYVVRRLRKGFLYVYYPQDKTWDYYKIQTNGRLERMQGDLHHGMGRSDAACARFSATPSNLLLTVDPSQHPEFWIAFSDAPWTETVRRQVAANPDEFMQHVKVADDLMAFEGDQFIKSTVLGFQDKPLTDTQDREAYPRTPCDSANDTWQALLTHNQPFKSSGLVLALHDDIGITTQLNFERNAALLDILGENKRYTEDDRARMDTAGLIEQLEYVVGEDAFGRMKEHLKGYDKYLKLYRKCRDASVDFDSYSHDYTVWMQHTLAKGYWKLFDPAVPTIGNLLGTITADLFEGCGLTEQEFTKILEPQLSKDANDPQQLFWRGAAAHSKSVLALLANAAVDKTLLEAVKQGDALKAQVEYLKQFHEAKEAATKLNKASWSRLARVIATRARKLHQADAKVFRRTMRRVQGLTLNQSDLAVLERKVEGTAAEYLAQWREGISNASGLIRRTPKNTGEIAALSQLIVATWKPGEPLQPYFLEAIRQLGVPPDALPASTTVEVTPAEAAPMQLRAIAGLNAGIATLQILSFVESVHALGVDVTQLTQGQKPHIAQMTKDFAATGASLAGAASAGYETAAVLKQLAVGGTKTREFWLLSLKAGRLGLWAAAFEAIVGSIDATRLWESGDVGAGGAKFGAAGVGLASGISGYAALRITATSALKKAAMEAALGTAGELAADAATAAAVTRGGAVVTSEVPVAAVVLTILSTTLWVTSIGFEIWSRYLTTSPLEKWADRSFIGDHSGDYGHAYTSMKMQLDDLLRLLYAVKIKEPSAFGLDNAMTISVPAYGEASELDIEVRSNDRTVGHYLIDGLADGDVPVLQNLARPQPGLVVHAQAELEDGGLKVEIRIGGADSKWLEDAKQMGLRILVPAWGFYDTTHKLIEGVPTAKVHYYPNKAAYPHLWIDGKSLEDIIEKREQAK